MSYETPTKNWMKLKLETISVTNIRMRKRSLKSITCRLIMRIRKFGVILKMGNYQLNLLIKVLPMNAINLILEALI